ncbi:hypothetical protein [Salinispora vitiensis]|uniref:hypothetical protein n=1 Tax=Salinispora vitiensis TaxID=999544 RepID=UPI00035EC9EF|nr:hypothetical protein [Salinispora vitiensis]
MVALLDQAVELGAIHGRCDDEAEMTAYLLGRPIPDHVEYDISPTNVLTMRRNGIVTELPLPSGLKPLQVIGQLARYLPVVFAIAGRLADEVDTGTKHASDGTGSATS